MKKRFFAEIALILVLAVSNLGLAIYVQRYVQKENIAQLQLFFFYSPECPNCKASKPIMVELMKELVKKHVTVRPLNVLEEVTWDLPSRLVAQKVQRALGVDFIPLPTAVVWKPGRFLYTFVGRDSIPKLADFFVKNAGIGNITAKLDIQNMPKEECLACHKERKLPPPSTYNCTYCCHKTK